MRIELEGLSLFEAEEAIVLQAEDDPPTNTGEVSHETVVGSLLITAALFATFAYARHIRPR